MKISLDKIKLAVIGLGYVGLPLAVEFGKKREVIGFDLNHKRISDLENFIDLNQETASSEIIEARNLSFTSDPHDLKKANCYIVTVPTPIDESNKPDLSPLIEA